MQNDACSVIACGKKVVARSYCPAHWRRWRLYGVPQADRPVRIYFQALSVPERFWRQVRITESCWLWEGAKSQGYGVVRMSGRNMRAHRWAYEFCVGMVPDGLELDHLCRTPACVRPDHLEATTHRENILRSPICPIAVNGRKELAPCGHPYTKAGRGKDGRRCKPCRQEYERLRGSRRRAVKLGGDVRAIIEVARISRRGEPKLDLKRKIEKEENDAH